MDVDIGNTNSTISQYFSDDPLLPVYQPGISTPFASKVIAEEIINGVNPELIAKLVPHQPADNVNFMIGLDFLGHWKDVLSDNFGAWNANGTKTHYYTSMLSRNNRISLKSSDENDGSVKCVRHLYHYPTCKNFKRIVIKICTRNEDSSWVDRSPIFVQYYFEKGKENIVVPCHRNSKRINVPFFRTKESTKIAIKSKVDPLASTNLCNSKRIFSDMMKEKGGIVKIKSPADIPRNRQQIRNFHRNSANNANGNEDDLTVMLFECKEQSKTGDPFVREVVAAPELQVFLCNNLQLKDILRFCCNSINTSILGVDMTFNIGNYFVTVTVYRHKMLLTDKGVEPSMIGPVLIHQNKTFKSYYPLPSFMLKHCPELKDLQAFGTDGELALINAMKLVFCAALHLQCDLHMRENIEYQMKEYHIDNFLSTKLLFNIFGRQVGNSKLKGLVDCTSEEDFHDFLNTSVAEWKEFNVPDVFLAYFKEKSELIRKTMTAEIRTKAGLGNPPDLYRLQANGSVNNIITRT